MKRMSIICLVAVIIILAIPTYALANVDGEPVILDENTPYSSVLSEINESGETEDSGTIIEPVSVMDEFGNIEYTQSSDGNMEETNENTELYQTSVMESMDYLIELAKLNTAIIIAAIVVLLIAVYSLRWIH